MNHAETTKKFFSLTEKRVKREILATIAANYGIAESEAEAEVTVPEAENLLDYLTGPARMGTFVLMQKYNLI